MIPLAPNENRILVSLSLLPNIQFTSENFGEVHLGVHDDQRVVLLTTTVQNFIDISQDFSFGQPTGQFYPFQRTKLMKVKNICGSPVDETFFYFNEITRKLWICKGAIPDNLVNEKTFSQLQLEGLNGLSPNPLMSYKKTLTIPSNFHPDYSTIPGAVFGDTIKRTTYSSKCSVCKLDKFFQGDCSFHINDSCPTPSYYKDDVQMVTVSLNLFECTSNVLDGDTDDDEVKPNKWQVSVITQHPYGYLPPTSFYPKLKINAIDNNGAPIRYEIIGNSVFYNASHVSLFGLGVTGPFITPESLSKTVIIASSEARTSGTSFRLHKVQGSIRIYVGHEIDFENLLITDRPSDKYQTEVASIVMENASLNIDLPWIKGVVTESVFVLAHMFKPDNTEEFCCLMNACIANNPPVLTTQSQVGKSGGLYGNFIYRDTLTISTIAGCSHKPRNTFSFASEDEDILDSAYSLTGADIKKLTDSAVLLASQNLLDQWDESPPTTFDECKLIVNSKISGMAKGKALDSILFSLYCRLCGGFHEPQEGNGDKMTQACVEASQNIYATKDGLAIMIRGQCLRIKVSPSQGVKYDTCRDCFKKKPRSGFCITGYNLTSSKTYNCGDFTSKQSDGTSTPNAVCKHVPAVINRVISLAVNRYIDDVYTVKTDISGNVNFTNMGPRRKPSALVQSLSKIQNLTTVSIEDVVVDDDDEDLNQDLQPYYARENTSSYQRLDNVHDEDFDDFI
jgi:hypothetical protein